MHPVVVAEPRVTLDCSKSGTPLGAPGVGPALTISPRLPLSPLGPCKAQEVAVTDHSQAALLGAAPQKLLARTQVHL